MIECMIIFTTAYCHILLMSSLGSAFYCHFLVNFIAALLLLASGYLFLLLTVLVFTVLYVLEVMFLLSKDDFILL